MFQMNFLKWEVVKITVMFEKIWIDDEGRVDNKNANMQCVISEHLWMERCFQRFAALMQVRKH